MVMQNIVVLDKKSKRQWQGTFQYSITLLKLMLVLGAYVEGKERKKKKEGGYKSPIIT